MMLGLLLARAGIGVTVLEKHGDFLRDFRGDTVHPSTLQLMHELGLLDAFLARPHDKAYEIRASVGGQEAVVADFRRLKTRCGFIAMVPQWEFLDFLREHASLYPGFHLRMNAEATELVRSQGRVTGVLARTPQGELRIDADLVIGADGRRSTLRQAAGLKVRDLGAPIDVLWMRIAKQPADPSGSGGRIGAGGFLAMIDRGSYWQCAYVIRKDGFSAIQSRGIEAFRADFATLVPLFAGRLEHELAGWESVKLLSVSVDRLERWWQPGLLCIGDAAHAMSPIGGVGINLAIQDAVATANLLWRTLADPSCGADAITPLLRQLQARRMLPTRVIQAMQVVAQNNVIDPVLGSTRTPSMPLLLKLLNRFPALRAIPAHVIGVGVRPEHVRSPRELRR
ncbi:MAG: Monooxygenase, binding [Ramlibacter sp.]|nr:Monooxygenase, binding [Ramlibacter sp.]